MEITFWGTRGSLAVPGVDTVKYGGNTSCVTMRPRSGPLIICDMGTGSFPLGRQLVRQPEPLDAVVLFSHGHWDHIQGFPFFAPFFRKDTHVRILGDPTPRHDIYEMLSQQMGANYFPVTLEALAAKVEMDATLTAERKVGMEQTIGSAWIQTFPIRHPGGGRAFRVDDEGRVAIYLTDHELPGRGPEYNFYVEICQGADLLIHDAQYTDAELPDREGWGHSSCEQATRFAMEAGIKRLALFHHDPGRSDAEIDLLAGACQALARASGSDLEVFGAREGTTFTISNAQ